MEKPDKWGLPLFVILIGAFMSVLDSSIVNVAISAMMNDFQTTTSKIQWVVTIYMLALGVIVPTSGWLGDFFGFKRLYIYSLGVFTIGSLFCSLAWSETVLIVARVVQAIGGGMIMPTTMSMIYGLVPRDKIGVAMGSFGIAMVVAPALGPSLGGYLVQYFSWRWIFTINLPVGIIGAFLAATVLPEFPHKKASKFDTLGCFASAAALFCLLLALSQGQDWGWKSLPIVMLFYLSLSFMLIFIIHELSIPDPLLDLRVFKYSAFTLGNLVLVIITIGMYGGLFYVPLFLQSIRGLGALKVGLLMLPPALISGFSLPISGKLYDRYGPIPPTAFGIVLLFLGTYLLTGINLNTSLTSIMIWTAIRSLGIGLTMMPVQTSVLSVLPSEQVGRGSAITNIISRVAGAFGLAFLTIMLNNKLAYHSSYLTWTISPRNLGDLLAVSSQDTAFSALQSSIAKIAFVNAIDDMFLITAFITISALLLTFFLPKSSGKKDEAKPIIE